MCGSRDGLLPLLRTVVERDLGLIVIEVLRRGHELSSVITAPTSVARACTSLSDSAGHRTSASLSSNRLLAGLSGYKVSQICEMVALDGSFRAASCTLSTVALYALAIAPYREP
jgi:hypothetical protein